MCAMAQACSRAKSWSRTLIGSHVYHGPGLLKGKGLAKDHDWKLCVSWCRFTQEQGAGQGPCLEFECLIPLIVTSELRGFHTLKPSGNFTNTVTNFRSLVSCLMGGDASGKMFFLTTPISFPEVNS